jgi:hydroxyacylglutathione hydrolase
LLKQSFLIAILTGVQALVPAVVAVAALYTTIIFFGRTFDASSAGASITIRAHGKSERFYADRVINCTGPSMNYRRVPSTLLQNMFNRGLVTSGPLGTGFHCSQDGAVIDVSGHTSEIIFNLGPGRLGDLIESIAVPEIRQQAVELASTLVDLMRSQRVRPEKTLTESATPELTGGLVTA